MLQKISKFFRRLLWNLKSAAGATVFPGALDSYSTKNAGDLIQEGHVNDLQDAVTASEVKIGINVSAVATSIDYKISNLFGNWETRVIGTVYQATTAGFVVAFSGSFQVTGFTDSNNPPTTVRCQDTENGQGAGSITMPVRKNDYWKVNIAGVGTVYWISIGT